jgi:hypothetical protein
MPTTKIEVAEEMLGLNEKQLFQIEIRKAYLTRKMVTDKSQKVTYELAQMTAEEKETKEWIAYLKEKIKDKFK